VPAVAQTRGLAPGASAGGARRGGRGFTLIEILLVLSIAALIGAVLIGGSAQLLDQAKEEDPETALLLLLQKARAQAVEGNAVIELVQLPNDEGFLLGEDGLEELPRREGGSRATLLKAEFEGGSLIAGQIEETPLERLRFYPDGSCDPARVQVRRGEVRRVYAIDPWTAAPLPDGGARR
jgi:prepilin-type N-terminal cleavage/methylation domain-containing protein